eukprot:SAG31_NODE_264_length_18835_cov_7.543553_17_plen_168_part_00
MATSVHQDITATCVCLSDGTSTGTAILLGLDLLWIQNPGSDEIRQQIGARLGVPATNVLINCSHTHLGPMTGWYKDGIDGENYASGAPGGRYNTAPADAWRQTADSVWQAFCCQCNIQDRYLDSLRDSLCGLAAQAHGRMVPGRAGSATGSSALGAQLLFFSLAASV